MISPKIFIISLFLLPSLAWSFPAQFVQVSTCTAAANTCTIPITAKANNVIVVAMCAQRAAAAALTLTPSDTATNTYLSGYAELDGGTSTAGQQVYYAENNSAAANIITCTRTGATNQKLMCIAVEVSGIVHLSNSSANGKDLGVRQAVSATPWSSSSAAMSVPDYLAGFGCCFNDLAPTFTAGTGFTMRQDTTGNNLHVTYEDQVSSGIFTTSASETISTSVTGVMGVLGLRERINSIMRNSY